jgi:hypothetical protein
LSKERVNSVSDEFVPMSVRTGQVNGTLIDSDTISLLDENFFLMISRVSASGLVYSLKRNRPNVVPIGSFLIANTPQPYTRLLLAGKLIVIRLVFKLHS